MSFIRGSGRYSFRLSLLHLQNQSLHYRVLDSVLIDFNLIEDYKKWFNGYINGDLKTLFEAAKIILQKIPNWHILKELTIAKLKEKKGEAYIEEFQKFYKNMHQQIFVSFVEMESVVAAFGDKIKNADFIAQALDLKTKELESIQNNSNHKSLDSNPQILESLNAILLDNNIYSLDSKQLYFILQHSTAKQRIHNHLSYKLGKAMIENSKSILGYIRMPYVLSYIKEQHNQEQKQYQEQIKKNPNLKLPKLESYKDYKEALKEKECFHL